MTSSLECQLETISFMQIFQVAAEKYDQLLEETTLSTCRSEIHTRPPYYLFIPQSVPLSEEFSRYISLVDILPVNTMGMTTVRGKLASSADGGGLRDYASSCRKGTRRSLWPLKQVWLEYC